MPRTSPVAVVLDAVVDALTVASGITGVASVYQHVPQNTAYPYLEVTCHTDRREDALGQLGVSLLVDVKAVSQYRGESQAADLISAAIGALSGQSLSVSGHTVFGVAWEHAERFKEVVNGIVTRHHVATFRIWTGQA